MDPVACALLQMLALADVNKDGVIQYEEFVPLCVEMIQAVEDMGTVADYSDAELEDYIARLFAIGDVNGDGVLEPAELQK